jgi:hypothetical protein
LLGIKGFEAVQPGGGFGEGGLEAGREFGVLRLLLAGVFRLPGDEGLELGDFAEKIGLAAGGGGDGGGVGGAGFLEGLVGHLLHVPQVVELLLSDRLHPALTINWGKVQ